MEPLEAHFFDEGLNNRNNHFFGGLGARGTHPAEPLPNGRGNHPFHWASSSKHQAVKTEELSLKDYLEDYGGGFGEVDGEILKHEGQLPEEEEELLQKKEEEIEETTRNCQ